MSLPDPKNQNTASWITSLAISITCCSILFVIFAGYISDWKESLVAMRVRFETMTERMNAMNDEIDNLRRHNAVQQIQILPSPNGAPVQLPVSVMPSTPDAQPAAAPVPDATAPSAPATPPVTAPKAAPVAPVKHP